MYLLLIILPFIGSCSAGLFGRKLGPQGFSIITTGCLSLSFLLSFFVFYEVALIGCCTYIKLTNWMDWGFMFDSFTVSMCCVVTFVHLYSIEYMSYLSLFIFFILIFITFRSIDYSSVSGLNSCLTCDAPEDWQAGLSEPASISMEGILIFNNHLLFLLIVITLFVGWLLYNIIFFYAKKNRRKLSTLLLDAYVNLFFTLLTKRAAPRWFTMSTLGLGSFIVKGLFFYKYINAKLGIILAFTLPMSIFLAFVVLTVLPFHLAASFPDGFGKRFFRFLEKKCSKNVFRFIERKSITKPLQIRKIQIRSYSATSKVNTVLSELAGISINKINLLLDPTHAKHVRVIKDVIRSSFIDGNWPTMRRKFPIGSARALLEQACACPKKAELLYVESIVGTGAFTLFRYPEGPIQLAIENVTNDLIMGASNFIPVDETLRASTSQLVGEVATNSAAVMSVTVVGLTTAGLIFCANYEDSFILRERTHAFLLAGRTLDNEGDFVAPCIIDTNEDIPASFSDISDQNSQKYEKKNVDYFFRKLLNPELIFADKENNDNLFAELRRSQSDSSLLSEISEVNSTEVSIDTNITDADIVTLEERFKILFRR
jgi:hypothetical protein